MMSSRLALMFILCYSTVEMKDYSEWKVLYIRPLTKLDSLLNYCEVLGSNCMRWGISHEGGVSFALGKEESEKMSEMILQLGLTFNITNDNLGSAIQNSNMHDISRDDMTLNKYNTWTVIKTYLESLNTVGDKHISESDTEIIGKTVENRPIYLVRLSKPMGKNECPCGKGVIVVSGGINAREWISTACSLYLIHELKNNPALAGLLQFDWYILPLLNPDGYEYTFDENNGDRLWNKNRRQSNISTECYGVDINRNFGYMWDKSMPFNGGSRDPCHNGYIGEDSFSEAESNALKMALMRKVKTLGYFSIHALGEYLSFAPAFRTDDNSNSTEMDAGAETAVEAIKEYFDTEYKVGTRSELLGDSPGNSIDYARYTLGIRYSYDFELRDIDEGNAGFLLPSSEIVPTCSEMIEGIKALINEISK